MLSWQRIVCLSQKTVGHKYISKVSVLQCVCPVKNAFLLNCLHFPHCWSAFYCSAGCDVIGVICRMTVVTWFDASTNQRHSAFLIPHFTFHMPHSAIPCFTHYRDFPLTVIIALTIQQGRVKLLNTAACAAFCIHRNANGAMQMATQRNDETKPCKTRAKQTGFTCLLLYTVGSRRMEE